MPTSVPHRFIDSGPERHVLRLDAATDTGVVQDVFEHSEHSVPGGGDPVQVIGGTGDSLNSGIVLQHLHITQHRSQRSPQVMTDPATT